MSNAAPIPLDEARADRDRRARVMRAIRTGERIATDDVRDHEYFLQAQHHVLMALGTALHLTGAQYRLILMVLSHSLGLSSSYAICDLCDKETPTLADWCAWLRIRPQAFCATRADLVQARVLLYDGGDPNHLAINSRWEEWDPALFADRTARSDAGRKPVAISKSIAITEEIKSDQPLINKLTNLAGINEQINFEGAGVNLQINGVPDENAPEARQDAARADEAPTREEIIRKKENTSSLDDHSSNSAYVRTHVRTHVREEVREEDREEDREDWVDEYARILNTLHEVDGWRRTPRTDKLEQRFLEEICPISVGSVGGYPPAFIATRATEFAFWWQTKVQPAADARGEVALPDIAKFRRFHDHDTRKAYNDWCKQQRQAEHTATHAQDQVFDVERNRQLDEEDFAIVARARARAALSSPPSIPRRRIPVVRHATSRNERQALG